MVFSIHFLTMNSWGFFLFSIRNDMHECVMTLFLNGINSALLFIICYFYVFLKALYRNHAKLQKT